MPVEQSGQADTSVASFLLLIMDGCSFASAMMPWGRPGPIRLPEDPARRLELVEAHLCGGPASVSYAEIGKPDEIKGVAALQLFALCPRDDGLCRWIGIDIDASDGHGWGGLADPPAAARCIAEQAANAGLGDGLVVARSRSGKGRHVWMIPTAPCPLAQGIVVVASLAEWAHLRADQDFEDSGELHAFRDGKGGVAGMGKPGAVELIPKSTEVPRRGWSLALPASGVLGAHGGGVIVDPFSERPTSLKASPRCDTEAWESFVLESERLIANAAARLKSEEGSRGSHRGLAGARPKARHGLMQRLDPRTLELLHGQVPKGHRNAAVFAGVCNMLGVGLEPAEASRLGIDGALACGLSESEARSVVKSAMKARRRRP